MIQDTICKQTHSRGVNVGEMKQVPFTREVFGGHQNDFVFHLSDHILHLDGHPALIHALMYMSRPLYHRHGSRTTCRLLFPL